MYSHLFTDRCLYIGPFLRMHTCARMQVHTHTHTHTRGCQWLLIHNGAGSGACIERESLYLEGTRSVKRCGPIRRDDAISSGATCCPASRVMERRKRGIGVRRLGERSLHLFIRRSAGRTGIPRAIWPRGPPPPSSRATYSCYADTRKMPDNHRHHHRLARPLFPRCERETRASSRRRPSRIPTTHTDTTQQKERTRRKSLFHSLFSGAAASSE